MRIQEAALESTFQKIARIISAQYNITVVVRGTRAYIDMKTRTIVLPSLGTEMVVGVEHILDGLLDHETAHAIDTDPLILEREKPSEELHGIWNACEDARIEKLMSKRYYGCGQNLAEANRVLFAKVAERWPTMKLWQKLMASLSLCWEQGRSPDSFKNEAEVGALVGLIAEEIEAGRTAASTAEALDISKKILEKLTTAMAQEGKSAKQEKSDDKEKDEGKTEPKGKEEGEDSEAEGSGGDSGDEEDDSAHPPSGGDSDSGEPDEPGDDSDPEADGGGEESPEEDDESGEAGSPEEHADDGEPDGVQQGAAEAAPGVDDSNERQLDASEKVAEQAQALQAELDHDGPTKALDLEGLVNDHLEQVTDHSKTSDPPNYYVFSEEFDEDYEFGPEARGNYTPQYEKLKSQVRRYIGTMASQLELALAAQTQARWVPGERGRRFDRRKLAAWMEGSDDPNIYRVLEQGERLDTAVTMLWDCSGSMGNSGNERNKAALARLAAIAFHEALKSVQIPHEVLGFNTGGSSHPGLTAAVDQARRNGENLEIFSRLDERDNRFVFVPFGSSDGRALCHITGGAANRDGEAVLWAAKRLAARREVRKVLIVGSDGQPAGARYARTERDYLREVVRKVMGCGIEVFGLGIMDGSVQEYYPHWAVVTEAEQLPRAVMAQLLRHLTGAGMRQDAISYPIGSTAA